MTEPYPCYVTARGEPMNQVAKAHQVKRNVVDDLADIANIAIERAEKERTRAKALEAVVRELQAACDAALAFFDSDYYDEVSDRAYASRDDVVDMLRAAISKVGELQ